VNGIFTPFIEREIEQYRDDGCQSEHNFSPTSKSNLLSVISLSVPFKLGVLQVKYLNCSEIVARIEKIEPVGDYEIMLMLFLYFFPIY
jgi:hypothetical protein